MCPHFYCLQTVYFYIAGCRRDLHSCWLNKIFILFEGDVQVKNEKSLWGLHSCSIYDFMNLVLISHSVEGIEIQTYLYLRIYRVLLWIALLKCNFGLVLFSYLFKLNIHWRYFLVLYIHYKTKWLLYVCTTTL